MFSLKDKVALVTGASQGIGRDTALALTEAGAKVVVAARNEEKLAALVGEIVLAGGQALAVKMVVADTEQVRAGFKQVIEKFARLDILVNNAAITHDGLSVRMKQQDWEAVIRTNLTGAHLCIQQALGTMMRARDDRSNIDNAASARAHHGSKSLLDAQVGTGQVRSNDGFPVVLLHTQRQAVARDGGVVHENIQAAEFLDYLLEP